MKVTCNGMHAEIADDKLGFDQFDIIFPDTGFMLQFTKTADSYVCTNAMDGWGTNYQQEFKDMKLEIVE